MKKLIFYLSLSLINPFVVSKNLIPTTWENLLQDPIYLPCASTLFRHKNTTDYINAKKASFATGKIIESLEIIAMTFCDNSLGDNVCNTRKEKTIDSFHTCLDHHAKNISQCLLEYPYVPSESSTRNKIPYLSSFGLHDTCDEIPDYYYCSILVFNQPSWTYGLCIPSVCSIDNIQTSLRNIMSNYIPLPSSYQNEKLFTSTCGDYTFSWTSGTSIMIVICALVFLLTCIGTFLPKTYQNIKLYQIFYCFSLQENLKFLLKPPRGKTFDVFDGMRTFSILWVLFGHTFVFTMMGLGFTNLVDLIGFDNKGWITTYPAQALTGGYYAVDTFFFMSGFLAMFFLMKRAKTFIETKNYRSYFFQIPFLYMKRFLRLTPLYFFILLFYINIFPLMDSGPFWNLLNTDLNTCKKYWWHNLLYINNLYSSSNQDCYAVSWYLANDFQFFLLVPFFAFLSVFSPKQYTHLVSISLLSLACILSITFAFVRSYQENWSINIYDTNFLTGYFTHYYTAPWFRFPPYFMGMILAIVWYFYFDDTTSPFLQDPSISDEEVPFLSKPQKVFSPLLKKNHWIRYCLFGISLFLFGITVLGGQGAYTNVPPDWSTTTMSFYISLSKPAWTLGLCIFSILLFLDMLPLLSSPLTNSFTSIVAKLTYCVYLIHPCIIYWFYFSQIYPFHYNGIWYTMTFFSITVTSFFISFFLYLFVEKPIANMTKFLFL
jgi:peptidoglycan/LPS O-acetylase OafA/YrhL